MYSTLFQTFAIGAAFAARHVLAADLAVLTPTLVQCENATVQFTGGQPNYLVSVVPSDDPCADSLLDIPQTSNTQVQFVVAIAAGTSVDVVVDSADEEEGWSATVVVQPGKDSSCLPKNVTTSSSTPAASSIAQNSSSSTPTPVSTLSSLPSDSTPGANPFSAPPVQSGTIGSSGNSSDDPVNVGSDPNSTNAASSTTLSLGSMMASVFLVFAVSQL